MFRWLFRESRSSPVAHTARSAHESTSCEDRLFDEVAAPAVGQVLNGRYRLEQAIGRGGAGVVYRGLDLELGHPVAIKVLSVERIDNDGQITQAVNDLRTEALAAMRLSHPLILRVYNYERHAPWEYLIMEFVPGQSLDERRRSRPTGRLKVKETVLIGLDVLEALGYAHQQGVIHNDITPRNILIDQHEALKVCDFGLARFIDLKLRRSPTLLAGTAAYISPERVLGVPIDARSDLYSLGATLYGLCGGRPPFDIRSFEVLKEHINDQPSHSPHIPPALDTILRKALEPDPEARFADAHEMREALVALLCARSVIPASSLHERQETEIAQRALQTREPLASPESRTAALDGSKKKPAPPRDMAWISPRKLKTENASFDVAGFYLDRTPVTNKQYAEFVVAEGELPPAWWPGSRPPKTKLDHPVVGITIGQARRYAAWRGKRLPTTLEWIAVVRGEEERRFPWGNTCDGSCCQCPRDKPGDTAAVDAHPAGASPEGCMDLLGNVWEWTGIDTRYAPTEAGYHYVLGGSYQHQCRADQGLIPQTTVGEHGEYLYLGFRCARDGDHPR